MSNQATRRFYTVAELQEILHMGRATLYKARKAGKIPGEVHRGQKRVLFFAPIIDDWIKTGAHKGVL